MRAINAILSYVKMAIFISTESYLKVVKGENTGSITLPGLTIGTYLLIIGNDDGLLTSKIIIE